MSKPKSTPVERYDVKNPAPAELNVLPIDDRVETIWIGWGGRAFVFALEWTDGADIVTDERLCSDAAITDPDAFLKLASKWASFPETIRSFLEARRMARVSIQ